MKGRRNKILKGQLVSQYVEKISRKLLEKYPQVIRDIAKGQHGIYALYKGNKLYYVGLASNLRRRLRHHLRDRHKATWDRFSLYLTLSDKPLRELESLVLRIASPKGNLQAGKFLRAKNLKRAISRKISEMQRRERMDFLGEESISKPSRVIKKEKGISALAPYITKRIHLRFRYKGKLYIANARKDGWITFDFRSADYNRLKNTKFKSPSAAAAAVTGHPMSGWRCWKYKNRKGEWVYIDELRKKL
ncbi:MAG: DUF4357 domain-containing protein [Candidatus Helarchaeota archaeon]